MGSETAYKMIEYKGYLADGTMFDCSTDEKPLRIVDGRYTVMEPIVNAVATMELGEEATVEVPSEKAYGDYDEKALIIVPRQMIEAGDKLEKGQMIIWHSREKPQPVAVRVDDCDEHSVRLDFNHPLAGKDLTYWIKVVDVG